jgi:hypothetical protein
MKREHLWAHHEQDANGFWKLAEGGYASPMSVRTGDQISLHISNSRSYYEVQIFREGRCRELLKVIPDLRGRLQPVPPFGYRDGFGWDAVTSFTIPNDWKSGVYIASFATPAGVREILFVVRPRKPRSPLLLTISSNTYAAYNNVGGKCFYNYISTGNQHANLISFERPFQPDTLGNFYIWDQFFVSWLDDEGFDVDYCINSDHDIEPDLLDSYRANLRIGHDEYNSMGECEQLQRLVRRGGNLLVFAGNAFYKEVEVRNSGRQVFCAQPYYQPPTPERPETSFLELKNQMRQRTIGVSYTSYINAKTATPGIFCGPTTGEFGFYRVVDPTHWIFEGTGLKEGDEFGREDSIVGVEADAADLSFSDGHPYYTGVDGVSPHYKILAIADAVASQVPPPSKKLREANGEADAYATITINESEFPGTVFNAATVEWAHGLYRDDSVVATITRNVLNRLGR